ncbi:MAG: sensor histidine kinase [Prevotella sp.]|nr:sensor histidine kinase [Prevotella sp.]
MNKQIRNKGIGGVLLHVFIWAALFLLPLSFVGNEEMSLKKYAMISVWPCTWAFGFYFNYFWNAPLNYVNGQYAKTRTINAIIVVTLAVFLHVWTMHNKDTLYYPNVYFSPNTQVMLFFRDIYNLTLATTLGCAIVMSRQWMLNENRRKEVEVVRREAELKSLKYQLQPHFLLNTLNNIYALTSFDQQKAQTAIKQFSELLQHQLYNNHEEFVDIKKEADFIHNYINLMRIRLSSNVKVMENIDIAPQAEIYVSPMIFITLVENAFKHGVSANEECFIRIDLKADKEEIVFEVENSNHPKDTKDKSGHGIGLTMLKQKLDIIYPDKYEWNKGLTTNQTYTSKITIYDTKLRNH